MAIARTPNDGATLGLAWEAVAAPTGFVACPTPWAFAAGPAMFGPSPMIYALAFARARALIALRPGRYERALVAGRN